MKNVALVLLAFAAGIGGGISGARIWHTFVQTPVANGAPYDDTELREALMALQQGEGQTEVPEIVREFVTRRLSNVPYAERAGTADHALVADVAKEADFALETDFATEAARATEADFAAKAEESVTAERAAVATTADEALYAVEADVAVRADEAKSATFAEEAGDRDRYYLRDRTGLGIVDNEDDEDDKPKTANLRRGNLVSVETRRTNLVSQTTIILTLSANRPVYLALGDGHLELDPGSAGEFVLLRDGAPVFRGEFSNPSPTDELRIPAGAISTIDTPGQGTHEFVLQMTARNGRIAVREVRLMVIEL